MAYRVQPFLILSLVAVGACVAAMEGCSRYDRATRPAWRDQAEETCLAKHLVEPSAALQPARAISGPGICGLDHPFKVYALADGTVKLNTASLLDCSMIPTLDRWIKEVVQPDAMARFGEPVVQINTMGTYSCRGINNQSGASLSEHAFANAMDVGGFVLASGRQLNVMRGWSGQDIQESAFLRDSHAGACTYFTTVLGPGANVFHYNHIHMDLAMHGNTSRGARRYCKPVPDAQIAAPKLDNLPDPPPIEEEMDMAQAPIPAPSLGSGGATFVASVPETAPTYRMLRQPDHRPEGMASGPMAPLALAPLPATRLAARPSLDVDQAGGADEAPVASPEGDITSLIRANGLR